jgi:replication factor C subunit 1
VISEDEFLKMIESSQQSDTQSNMTFRDEKCKNKNADIPVSSSGLGDTMTTASVRALSSVGFKTSTMATSSSSSSAKSYSQTQTNRDTISDEDSMWVDKYKPKNLTEIIGSQETVRKLCDWLTHWDAAHVSKTMKIPYTKENPGAKAVLLSGPPGIGKTTMATLIGKHYGYEIFELNASDTRNKKSITEALTDVLQSQSISLGTSIKPTGGLSSKRLVIMDEVDGMGGSDRGGIQELIKVLKTSKNPIICICNDRMCPKVRSLANHCYDLLSR